MAEFLITPTAVLAQESAFSEPPVSLAAVLTDGNRLIVITVAVVAAAALVVAQVLVRQVLAAGQGTERMKEIAAAVQEGANAYLARQLRTVGVFSVVVFFLLFLLPSRHLVAAGGSFPLLPGGCAFLGGYRIHRYAARGTEQCPSGGGSA